MSERVRSRESDMGWSKSTHHIYKHFFFADLINFALFTVKQIYTIGIHTHKTRVTLFIFVQITSFHKWQMSGRSSARTLKRWFHITQFSVFLSFSWSGFLQARTLSLSLSHSPTFSLFFILWSLCSRCAERHCWFIIGVVLCYLSLDSLCIYLFAFRFEESISWFYLRCCYGWDWDLRFYKFIFK